MEGRFCAPLKVWASQAASRVVQFMVLRKAGLSDPDFLRGCSPQAAWRGIVRAMPSCTCCQLPGCHGPGIARYAMTSSRPSAMRITAWIHALMQQALAKGQASRFAAGIISQGARRREMQAFDCIMGSNTVGTHASLQELLTCFQVRVGPCVGTNCYLQVAP